MATVNSDILISIVRDTLGEELLTLEEGDDKAEKSGEGFYLNMKNITLFFKYFDSGFLKISLSRYAMTVLCFDGEYSLEESLVPQLKVLKKKDCESMTCSFSYISQILFDNGFKPINFISLEYPLDFTDGENIIKVHTQGSFVHGHLIVLNPREAGETILPNNFERKLKEVLNENIVAV